MSAAARACPANGILATKRFSGRQLLRSRVNDSRRSRTYRVYFTAKGQYAVYTCDEPNWSALARTDDAAPGDADNWEGDWWSSERSLHVFADTKSMRGILPNGIVDAPAHLRDQSVIEDLDI